MKATKDQVLEVCVQNLSCAFQRLQCRLKMLKYLFCGFLKKARVNI